MRSGTRRDRCGAVLLDAMAVVGIVVVLFSLLIPMIVTARDRSSRAQCMEHLREIGFGLRAYAAENHGRLPATRPGLTEPMVPDISNSGFAASNPFGQDGPKLNNIPAVLFLLVRTRHVSASALVCPATRDVADDFGGHRPEDRSNFTNLNRNLSYSVQNPYAGTAAIAAGFRWFGGLADDFAVVADRSPGPTESNDKLSVPGNSRNHGGIGQNVLYGDGRVEFRTTPYAGVQGDHIYCSHSGLVLAGPENRSDSVLLPYEPLPQVSGVGE